MSTSVGGNLWLTHNALENLPLRLRRMIASYPGQNRFGLLEYLSHTSDNQPCNYCVFPLWQIPKFDRYGYMRQRCRLR